MGEHQGPRGFGRGMDYGAFSPDQCVLEVLLSELCGLFRGALGHIPPPDHPGSAQALGSHLKDRV